MRWVSFYKLSCMIADSEKAVKVIGKTVMVAKARKLGSGEARVLGGGGGGARLLGSSGQSPAQNRSI